MKQSKQISDSVLLMCLLTFSGGFMDAYSYICRDHVFANAQTGNILLMGVNLSTGNFNVALRYLLPVLSFAVGIAVAQVIRHFYSGRQQHFHWRQAVVLIEALVLLSVAFMPQRLNLLANSLTSLACGTQVQSFRRVNGVGVATTMCIGNLRSAVESICDYCFIRQTKSAINAILIFGIILTFVIGAVFGNLMIGLIAEKAILISSVIMIISFLLMFINHDE